MSEHPSAEHMALVSAIENRRVRSLKIGVVAAEVSGDVLGAALMQQVAKLHPRVEWFGVGGPLMEAQGLKSLFPLERLSKMGLVEVLAHLPDLLKAKRQLVKYFLDQQVDLFIGIDGPDMNLRIAKPLKEAGVYAVQYVSPSVWAWRESRMETIKKATDLVLCLFPFELDVYKKHAHPAAYVGHPALQKISRPKDAKASQRDLIWRVSSLKSAFMDRKVSGFVGLLPGSRASEVQTHMPLLVETAKAMLAEQPDLVFLVPAVTPQISVKIKEVLRELGSELVDRLHLINLKNSEENLEVMAACDLLILVSGTVTFEALLLEKPMVVVYKMNAVSHFLAKRLIKLPYVSLPNILAGAEVVPELIQPESASVVAQEALATLFPSKQNRQITAFRSISKNLRETSAGGAGAAVLSHYFHR